MKSKYDKYIPKILKYWFRNDQKEDFKRWFQEGMNYDTEIRQKFAEVLKEAEQGKLLHWIQSKLK